MENKPQMHFLCLLEITRFYHDNKLKYPIEPLSMQSRN